MEVPQANSKEGVSAKQNLVCVVSTNDSETSLGSPEASLAIPLPQCHTAFV